MAISKLSLRGTEIVARPMENMGDFSPGGRQCGLPALALTCLGVCLSFRALLVNKVLLELLVLLVPV